MVGILLLLSALSDMLDGLIARRLHQVTALGRILDPMADKLTLIAVVIGLNVLYPDMVPFTLILFCKEMLMLTGGAFLLRMRLHPPLPARLTAATCCGLAMRTKTRPA